MSKVTVRKLSPWAALGSAADIFGSDDDVRVDLTPTERPVVGTVRIRPISEAVASPWRRVGELIREAAAATEKALSDDRKEK